MVYFILGILILLFLPFMTPKSIRGTLNSVTMVVLIVSIIVLTCLAIFRYSNYRLSFFVGAFLAFCWLPGFGGYFQNDDQTEKINADVIFKALWAFLILLKKR